MTSTTDEKMITLVGKDGVERTMTLQRYKLIILSRTTIKETGKYELEVTQVGPEYKTKKGNTARVVSFKAHTEYHIEAAKKLRAEGEYQEAMNQQLTMNIFKKDDGTWNWVPAPKEIVNAQIGIIDYEGGEGLGITAISEIKAKTAKKATEADVFGDEFNETSELDAIAAAAKAAEETAKKKLEKV